MTEPRIDLIWLGNSAPNSRWPMGETICVVPQVRAVCDAVQQLTTASSADYWLFWHEDLGSPSAPTIGRLLDLPGDVWHAGLRLGTGGQPNAINFVTPLWMLNRDPDPGIEATSWRMSLQACLLKRDVIRQLGGPDPGFTTLTGAALELGHRFITNGVFMRHVPWMVASDTAPKLEALTLEDEFSFLKCRFGTFWNRWALWRSVMVGYASPWRALNAWREVQATKPRVHYAPYSRPEGVATAAPPDRESRRVSVLIPTIDRYPYLRTLLTQLSVQTVRPFEIIIVDQTTAERRDTSIANDFADLPLKLIYLETEASVHRAIPGCSPPQAITFCSSTTTTKFPQISSSVT